MPVTADALICVFITMMTAAVITVSVTSHYQTQQLIEKQAVRNRVVMKEGYSLQERCERGCRQETENGE